MQPAPRLPARARASSCQAVGTTWFFSSCGGILELRRGSQPSTAIESVMPSSHLILCRLLLTPLASRGWAGRRGAARAASLRVRIWPEYPEHTFHFHALEKEMATHSSVLAWRIPGTGEPGGSSAWKWHPTPVFLPGKSHGGGAW